MRDIIENDESEDSSNAASLMKINVRKSKQDTVPEKTSPKTGDITERLAALAKELDSEEGSEYPERDLSLPQQSVEKQQSWAAGSADRRQAPRSAAASNGWGQRNAPPDILSYWMDIRGGQRRYPSSEALEPEVIGKYWPNCILVHCNRDVGRLQVKYGFTHAVRKAAYGNTPDEELLNRIEFTPMIIDWILGLGRDVAATRKPTHGTEYFPSVTGEFPLRVIALPLSDNGKDIDHVLCHIQKLQ